MILSPERLSEEYLSVNSCGIQRLELADSNQLRPKGRVDYHILYIMEGFCYTPVDGKMARAGAGELILFAPHEPQEYHFYKRDRSVSCYTHFTGTGCDALLRKIGLTGRRIFTVGTENAIGELFQRMEYEATIRQPFYEQKCAALLLELLTSFGRGLNPGKREVSFDYRIEEVCRLMAADYAKWNDMSYYADCCCLSLSRFYHVFRQSIGCSPNEYLMRLRVEQAAELLTRTDLAISIVAETLGFADENYFIRAFKKRKGKTPLRYRKQLI